MATALQLERLSEWTATASARYGEQYAAAIATDQRCLADAASNLRRRLAAFGREVRGHLRHHLSNDAPSDPFAALLRDLAVAAGRPDLASPWPETPVGFAGRAFEARVMDYFAVRPPPDAASRLFEAWLAAGRILGTFALRSAA